MGCCVCARMCALVYSCVDTQNIFVSCCPPQVERRVVNLLAMAFEQQTIKPGTRVKLAVDTKNKRTIYELSPFRAYTCACSGRG